MQALSEIKKYLVWGLIIFIALVVIGYSVIIKTLEGGFFSLAGEVKEFLMNNPYF